MSNIEQNLQKILSSKYGKDVRQAIHDGIHDCYEDGKAGAMDLVAREQIANLVAMNNPTEGNSELQDIRVGYDGTSYASAGEAVRGQCVVLTKCDLVSMSSVGFLTKSGKIEINGFYVHTGHIYCKNTIIDIKGVDFSNLYVDALRFYTSDGEYISSASSGSNITVPENAQYFILSYNAASNNVAVTVKPTSSENSVFFRSNDLDEDIRNIAELQETVQLNFDGSYSSIFLINDGYLLPVSGIIVVHSGYSCSDYILVSEGSTIEYVGETKNSAVASIVFYDKHKIFLSSLANNQESEKTRDDPVETIVPDGAMYCRISCHNSQKNVYVRHKTKNPLIDHIIKNLLKNASTVDDIDITNYASLLSFYPGSDWANGTFRKNSQTTGRTSTSLVRLDKTKYITSNNVYTGKIVFFDKNASYLSDAFLYQGRIIGPSDYPEDAEYVCFWYEHSTLLSFDGTWNAVAMENRELLRNYPYFLGRGSVIKRKGTRPQIRIFLSDSQNEIYKKLVMAVYTGDCDVYFEAGTYIFDTVYDYIKESYRKQGDAFEMLLGGNCRYYMNGCVFHGKHTPSPSVGSGGWSTFGAHRHADSYAIYGGMIICEGGVYCVHDEASGEPTPYRREYHNVIFKYITTPDTEGNGLRKCIGGGMGLNGHCIFDHCIFLTDTNKQALEWHGASAATEETPAVLKLDIQNCWFETTLALDPMGETTEKYKYNSAEIFACNNSFGTLPTFDRIGWTSEYCFGNVERPKETE